MTKKIYIFLLSIAIYDGHNTKVSKVIRFTINIISQEIRKTLLHFVCEYFLIVYYLLFVAMYLSIFI